MWMRRRVSVLYLAAVAATWIQINLPHSTFVMPVYEHVSICCLSSSKNVVAIVSSPMFNKGPPLLGINYPSKTWSCILMLPSF